VDDNQFKGDVHIALDADGGGKAQVKIEGTGGYRSMYVGMSSEKMDDQKEFLLRYLNLKQPSLFDIKESPDVDGVKHVNIDLEYDRFCDVMAGSKLFYRPHVFDLWARTLPSEEKRKTDYHFEHPMLKSCTTVIDLPQGFEVETLPSNTTLKFSSGNYEVNYVYNKDKNQVVEVAKFKMDAWVIPAAKYTELQQYMDAIAKAQNKKLVIRRKA
jgi:hypothetical protein